MKIFNKEDGKEIVYVQKNDIAYHNNIEEKIPASIYLKMYSHTEITIIADDNRMDFVSFDEPNEIEFFKKADYILDWNEYQKLSEEQLKEKYQEMLEQKNEKAETFIAMSNEDKEQNQHIIQECENLDYMMKYVQEFYWIKTEQKTMPFPQVPSSSGFKYVKDGEFPYGMSASLDPYIMYIYRKDKKPMTTEEEIPSDFYSAGIKLAISEKHNDHYSISNMMSEDKTKFIIKFKIPSYEDKKETEEVKSKKGLKSLVKSLLKKESK